VIFVDFDASFGYNREGANEQFAIFGTVSGFISRFVENIN